MNEHNANDTVLALYRAAVRNMLSGDKPGVVPNASYQHASIIVEELARCAKLRFYAYCGKMSPDVWSQPVLDQLQMAIGRGVDVQIVLTATPDMNPPAFLDGRVNVIQLNDLGEERPHVEEIGHFAVVDGKSLRLEQDKATRQALFAANVPQVAHELESIFGELQRLAA